MEKVRSGQSLQLDAPGKFEFDHVSHVTVRTFRGIVNIIGTDGPPTLELSRIRGRALEVDYNARRIEISQGKWPTFPVFRARRNRPGPVHFTLAIPRDCIVQLDLVASGGIVSGLRAGAKLRSVSGNLVIVNTSGTINAYTISGAIEAQKLTDAIEAETISGEISIIESSAEVYAKSISGPITLAVAGRSDSSVRLSTVSSDITVQASAEPNVDVSFHTISGNIIAAFSELNRADMPGMHFAKGILGNGKGKLWASSTSGNISLLPQPQIPDSAETGKAEERL